MAIFYEYETINHSKLEKHITGNEKLHPYFSDNRGIIKPKNYCGILHLEGEDFYILPKITQQESENLDIFIYMMMIAYDINLKEADLSGSKNRKHQILELFIQLFSQTLLKELTKGLFKTYVTYQENLHTLRGKYLIDENFKHNFTKQKIYCEFDEFSPDNPLNRFFLYAIDTFLPHSQNKKSLKMCKSILEEVSSTPIDIHCLHITFDRLSIRYEKSFQMGILILQKFIPLFSKKNQSFAFLFDMNELFENFTGKIVQRVVPHAKLQQQNFFGNLLLKPDILLDNLIIDTKYKKITTRDDLSTQDKYQMYVYGKNYHIPHTMLLYPKHLEKIDEDLVLGKEEVVYLHMRSLDLQFEGGFEVFKKEMEKRVKEIIW